MTEDTKTILDYLKDPGTYRKAWFGAVVPLIAGCIAAYVPDNHLSTAEFLTAAGIALGTGGTVFATKNKTA